MNSSSPTIHCKNIGNASEQEIEGIFSYFGSIISTKIIKLNNGENQAIVTFQNASGASAARYNSQELKTQEGFTIQISIPGEQNSSNNRKPNSAGFKQPAFNQAEAEDACHIYVGDFGPDIDNAKLKEHFAQFGKILHAKVILDTQTQTSKGYGFVTFANKDDAENAINKMNGQWIGYSTIKVNWATRKPTNPAKPLSYDQLYRQTSPTNRTVYIGNLDIHVPDEAIRDLCMQHGKIVDIKLHMHRGYGFVKYSNKDEACRAISQMHGKEICNVVLKCSWGKEDQVIGGNNKLLGQSFGMTNQFDNSSPYGQLNGSSTLQQPYGNFAATTQLPQSQPQLTASQTPQTIQSSNDQATQMSAANLAAYQQMYMMQYYQQMASNPALAQQYQQMLLQQQQAQSAVPNQQNVGNQPQINQQNPSNTPFTSQSQVPTYWNQK